MRKGNKCSILFKTMSKIGLIGFGGGNALIPVIEKTAVKEQELVSKEDIDVDIMVASITPGALPVEIAGGIGRRIMGSIGLLWGASAMALPGVVLTLLITSVMTQVNETVSRQISFLAVGISAFICFLLLQFIQGTLNTAKKEKTTGSCMAVFFAVVLLTFGKNLVRLMPGERTAFLSLSTIQIFALLFFVVLFTKGSIKSLKGAVAGIFCILFILCNCKRQIINSLYIKYAVEGGMFVLSLFGLATELKSGSVTKSGVVMRRTAKELITCLVFLVLLSLPAVAVTSKSILFVLKGFLSSVMSFGGGDAYLTVADGMFVQSRLITEEEFYSFLVPLVNVLPGSILCKTLSGVGYYIGLNETGTVIGALAVAISGFATSVAASCGVFSLVAGIYDNFGTLKVFQLIKKWIRPIVSALLVNVMLALLVQVLKLAPEFISLWMPFGCFLLILVLNLAVCRNWEKNNMKMAFASALLSLILCNAAMLI